MSTGLVLRVRLGSPVCILTAQYVYIDPIEIETTLVQYRIGVEVGVGICLSSCYTGNVSEWEIFYCNPTLCEE